MRKLDLTVPLISDSASQIWGCYSSILGLHMGDLKTQKDAQNLHFMEQQEPEVASIG